MSEREDYADLPIRPLLGRRARKCLAIGVAISIVSLLGFLIFSLAIMKSSGRNPRSQSLHGASTLVQGCENYRSLNPSGTFPATLADLLKPPFNPELVIIDSEKDLKDGWGNPFYYAVVNNALGQTEVFVWTEIVEDGRTTLIGAKLTALGEIVRFGLPPK